MSEPKPTDTQEPIPAAAAAASEPEPADQLAAAKQEAAANYDRFMRAVADLENFRKRTLREKEELRQFATTAVMQDLIAVLDNLALGLAAARQQSDVKGVVDGMGHVLEQFKGTLARHGLKEVDPAGQDFDPHQHECIAHQPSGTVPGEKVLQVVRSGYQLNGRLLRPASVIVSSGPAAEAKV
jgi:molecular chaperone GrpE